MLAALSGEVTVTTGFLVAGERPLPCRLSTEPATWRILLEHAREVEEQLMAHRNFPVGRLAGELGRPGPLFETVLDPAGDGGELAEHTALWLGVHRHPDRLELRLRYRSDVLDAEASARIAGYHRSALAPCAGRRPILGGRSTSNSG